MGSGLLIHWGSFAMGFGLAGVIAVILMAWAAYKALLVWIDFLPSL